MENKVTPALANSTHGGAKTVSCTVTGGNGKVATATKDIKLNLLV